MYDENTNLTEELFRGEYRPNGESHSQKEYNDIAINHLKTVISSIDFNTVDNLETALISHYSFDGDVNDSVGSENLLNTNISIVVDSKFGQSGSFDAPTSYAVSANPSAFDLDDASSFTISVWIKTTATADNKCVISNGHGFNDIDNDGYYLGVDATNGLVNFGVTGSTVNGLSSTTIVNDGAWYHVVAVLDRTNGMKLYINGILEAQNEATESGIDLANSFPFTIGRWDNGDGTIMDYWDGGIDDIRLYNQALSDAEVSELYNFIP